MIPEKEISMTDSCCCPPEAGNAICELPGQNFKGQPLTSHVCPNCGVRGKPVLGQTVKALLSVSLIEVHKEDYLLCKTQTCPVVYFSLDGEQTFTVEQVRERVYQKEPESNDVCVCYCFQHAAGSIRSASPEMHMAILDDTTRHNAGQCACDLRNPQGSYPQCAR
jgi:hypothetical protein